MNRAKRRFQLDLERCLSDSADDPPLEITLVKREAFPGDNRLTQMKPEQTPFADGVDKFRMKSDQELQETIQRITRQLKGDLCSRLPDKGDKYRATLKCCQEEIARRRLQTEMQGANECTSLEDTMRSRPMGVHAEPEKEAPSCQAPPPSEFSSRLIAMLETGNTSSSSQSNNEQVIGDDFEKDLRTLDQGDRRKREVQNTRFSLDDTKKNGLSLQGEERTRLVSISSLNDRERDLTENNVKHKKEARRILRSYKSNNKKTVVLLDEEEEPDRGDNTAATEVGPRDTKIYYPSRDDPESIEIEFKDLNCLAPGEYLTSTIMNFYMRFLQRPSFAAKNATNDYHFFNTYFYKKLQEAILRQRTEEETYFVKFRRWWRGVNIFQKAYIFLPVHEDLHWSLAIVCIPDKASGSGPIILHLDSLGYHSSEPIFKNIRRFLKEEWDFVKGESDTSPGDLIASKIWKHLPRRIESKKIKVPQQNNDFDCGLFVLYFMERFIKCAPRILRKKDLGMFGNGWFKPEEASNLREKIRIKLTEEFEKVESTSEPVNLASNVDSPRAS